MSLNFKDVDMPKEGVEYVKPGFWKLAPVSAELVAEPDRKPYVKINFEGDKGKLTEKFYLTEPALPRLQYLHFSLYGKRIEKDFSNEEFTKYLNTLFEKKSVPLNLKVGGEIADNGKVYARLVFNNFVIDGENFEEGAFEEGTARYNEVVKKPNYSGGGGAPQTNSPIVPNPADDKMPWDD